MKIKLIVALAASFSLSACATIIKGSDQEIAFNTGSVEGATCKVTGGSEFAVNSTVVTPGVLTLPRSKKALDVACSKPGMGSGSKSVTGSVEPWTFGNIVLGGVVGVGVDAYQGAIYKYPGTISVDMSRPGMDTPTVTGEPVS